MMFMLKTLKSKRNFNRDIFVQIQTTDFYDKITCLGVTIISKMSFSEKLQLQTIVNIELMSKYWGRYQQ